MPAVDANYRFIAAYQEVNARIAQRQQALALYVSCTLGLLAVVVALRPQDDAAAAWLALGFPVAALAFALLNHKTEQSISHLRRFLCDLERLDDAHLKLPSYNSDPRWAEGANSARRFHDIAAAGLVAGGNLAGLGAVLVLHRPESTGAWLPLGVAAGLALLAFGGVLATGRSHFSAPR